ncbi:MAG: hypothetical protein IT436_07400 [Phycisphaerales bacterium]|nr:hypothetical protein [Phycisphaerales bacterium]
MADAPAEKKKKDADKGGEPAAGGKKKPPIKVIGLVAVLMIAEAAGVFVIVSATAKKPAAAEAAHIDGLGEADHDASVEIPLLDEKFQNMQTGGVWIWDAEIILKVKEKNSEFVATQLENRAAEIKEGIAMIFRRAQHNQLKEPGLETINRQLTAYINKLIGSDAENQPRIERVMIPKCRGFPANF